VILDTIRVQVGQMSKAKQSVGVFLLERWRNASFLTASQVAAQAGVSESVVVRFAKDLGLSGFPELQAQLRELVMRDLGILDLYQGAEQVRASSVAEVIQLSKDCDLAAYSRTLDSVAPVQAEAAARMLLAAGQIAVLGSRSSLGPAAVLTLYLNAALGNTRRYDNASGDIYDQLRRLGPGDVALVILFRHYNKEVVAQAAFLHERGVPLIAITDSPAAPIAEWSRQVFFARTESPSFHLTHVGSLGIVNMLVSLVATLGDDSRLSQSLAETHDIYNTHYYLSPLANGGDR
jgi:DNA-binding MurR/RpiR family transcriptional regulator